VYFWNRAGEDIYSYEQK